VASSLTLNFTWQAGCVNAEAGDIPKAQTQHDEYPSNNNATSYIPAPQYNL
jgi:hypothetical protein